MSSSPDGEWIMMTSESTYDLNSHQKTTYRKLHVLLVSLAVPAPFHDGTTRFWDKAIIQSLSNPCTPLSWGLLRLKLRLREATGPTFTLEVSYENQMKWLRGKHFIHFWCCQKWGTLVINPWLCEGQWTGFRGGTWRKNYFFINLMVIHIGMDGTQLANCCLLFF